MPFRWDAKEHVALGVYTVKWLLIVAPVAMAIGSAVALFLWLLDWATATRHDHRWLLWLLPAAGAGIGAMYHYLGRNSEAGNNLIVEEIHKPGGGVPARMAPLVLIGTVVTHLFGGSAGREGTAVQMGGSIAGTVCRFARLPLHDTSTLLMAGVAAGFGAVFGTPLTGAIFAIEVLAIGQMRYNAIFPCLAASFIGDWTCTAWGIGHTHYQITSVAVDIDGTRAAFDWLLAGKVAVAAVAFGLVSAIFAELAHSLSRLFKLAIPHPVARPVVGGLIVIGLVYALGTRSYLGLGVSSPDPRDVTILSAFHAGGATPWSWWWKVLFTTITLSSGFKGGEVTPLFFIGATLGHALALFLNAPIDLFAGLGFVAVFAGATNTPLACTIMGIELFGAGPILYLAEACFIAFLLSGHSGIYLSQRIGTPKIGAQLAESAEASLRTARESRATVWHALKRRLRRRRGS